MSRLAAIKTLQLEQAEKTGFNPYAIAEQVELVAAAAATAINTDLAHYQAALEADLATLAGLRDLDAKTSAKRGMVDTYWPFLRAYIDNGDKYPCDVAVWLMIWLFDIDETERATELALHLVKQGCHVTPAKFDRDLPTLVCDQAYDWANRALKAQQSVSPYFDTLVAAIDNDAWSLSPPVHSKMYMMLAKHKAALNEWQAVVDLVDHAERVNPSGYGGKTLRADAQKHLGMTQD